MVLDAVLKTGTSDGRLGFASHSSYWGGERWSPCAVPRLTTRAHGYNGMNSECKGSKAVPRLGCRR